MWVFTVYGEQRGEDAWSYCGYRVKRFVVAGFTYLVGKSCTFLDETKKKSSTAC